jgi:tetrahydromethanopterin S-methyltransferase subunit A
MLKVEPASDYPPEEGRYLRGNDYSPVAVAVILNYNQEEIPPDIENLVRVATETGAALSGTLQTENIGVEKMICNIVANPNIRFLAICGAESPGHHCGQTLISLVENGVDKRRRIIGSEAPTPFLFNLPIESIERFRRQIRIVSLIDEGEPDLVRQAVWSCYQEAPTEFRGNTVWDPGAYPETALSGRLTWRVTKPELEPKDEAERSQRDRLRELMARIDRAAKAKKARSDS